MTRRLRFGRGRVKTTFTVEGAEFAFVALEVGEQNQGWTCEQCGAVLGVVCVQDTTTGDLYHSAACARAKEENREPTPEDSP